jgi:hypothetical protein
MKLNKLLKISKGAKWVVLIGSFTLITIAILFKLFAFLIWPELEFDSSRPRPMFSLNSTKYDYVLLKSSNGAYMINHRYEYGGKPNGITAFIGSSEIDLEPFIDKKIKITGKYRKTFGAPLCWDMVKCLEFKLNEAKSTVIDVEKLEAL